MTVTGFETPEIDVLIQELDLDGSRSIKPMRFPRLTDSAPPVSRSGISGCSVNIGCSARTRPRRNPSFRARLGIKAQMVFTDPPYNVRIDGNVCGLGAIKHREFQMASGEMSEVEFIEFLKTTLGHLAALQRRRVDPFRLHGLAALLRADLGRARRLQRAEEPVRLEQEQRRHGLAVPLEARAGLRVQEWRDAHVNNIELGRHGRYRTNVWDYAGINSMQAGSLDDLAMHPTVKPIALVADAILDCSKRGGIVLDCFGGSGTTLYGGREDRPTRPRDGARSGLRRRHHSALREAHRKRRKSC